jgi:nucleotide-binding universal stress UspA family protein
MNEINSIVVGIDYSENCANALREASRIANWNDAKLVCLHVIEEDIIRDFRLNETFDEQRVLDAAKERVEATRWNVRSSRGTRSARSFRRSRRRGPSSSCSDRTG